MLVTGNRMTWLHLSYVRYVYKELTLSTLMDRCDEFALRLCFQIGGFDLLPSGSVGAEDQDSCGFTPSQPREKWIRKRTSVKLNKLKVIN